MKQLTQHARSLLASRRSPSPGDEGWEVIASPDATPALERRHGGRVVSSLAGRRRDASTVSPVVARQELAHRRLLAPWDRIVDVVYHRLPHGDPRRARDPETDFARRRARFLSDHGRRGDDDGHGDADGHNDGHGDGQRQQQLSVSFTSLPPAVRFRICRHIVRDGALDDGSRPVSLNRPAFNKDCWDASDFVALGDLLVPLQPYLGVAFSLYADVMLVFLSEHVFHVTLSPFVGPRLSPLATTWLNRYGPYMRSLVVEVDLTRLLPDLGHVERLLRDVSMSLMRRDSSLPLESLVLLCRRFRGTRGHDGQASTDTASAAGPRRHHLGAQARRASPGSARSSGPPSSSAKAMALWADLAGVGESPDGAADCIDWEVVSAARKLSSATSATTASSSLAPGDQQQPPQQGEPCHDACLRVCNHLARLRGRVDSVRMCGFSERYTHQLIATLFPQARSRPVRQHGYRVAPSTVWPLLPGQRCCVDEGQGRIILLAHGAAPSPAHGARGGPWQLPPPVVGPGGTSSLPPAATAGSGGASSGPSRADSDATSATAPDDRGGGHGEREATAADKAEQVLPASGGKTRIQALLGKYGAARDKTKRSLAREAASP